MKRFIISLLICLPAISLSAHAEGIKVSYAYTHPEQNMRKAGADITNLYVLITNGKISKFYSPRTEYIDSIESTPEGFERFNTFKRACYEKKQQHLIPRQDGSFYVTKSFTNKEIMTYDVASGTRFKWAEPLKRINWEITDSARNILGYECFMATTKYHGRKWIAWFAPEIPLNDGPWKMHGLPGLILEAICEGEQYRFSATGIQQSKNVHYDVYSDNNWEPITGNDFWKLRRECLENPSRNLNAGNNSIVFQGVEYKKYLPKEIVDYIETDY